MSDKPKRPGVVLAAAIILFVFGGLSVLGIFGAVTPYVMPEMPQPKQVGNQPQFIDPTPKLVAEEPTLMAVMSIASVLGALVGGAKIWAGVGIMQLRPGARTAGIYLSLLTIVMSIAQSVYSALYFVPAYLRIFARENAPEIVHFQGIIEGALWGMTAFGIVGSSVLWIIVILLLNSRRARDAFAGISETPADEPEPERKPRSRYAGYDDDDDAYPRSSQTDTGITDRSKE